MQHTEPVRRSELLFVYDVVMVNPNGDPLNDGRPRIDVDGRLLVTDLRIKRTVRDYWDRALNLPVFYKRLLDEKRHLVTRQQLLAGVDSLEELLDRFVDLPIFGTVGAIKKRAESPAPRGRARSSGSRPLPGLLDEDTADEPDDPAETDETATGPEWMVSITGPVQFGQGRSLHRVDLLPLGLVSSLPSRAEKFQGVMATEYRVPYALIAVYGHVDPFLAALHRWLPLKTPYVLTEDQVDLVLEGLWLGTQSLFSHTKTGHGPRLLIQVRYRPQTRAFIGLLDQLCAVRLPPGLGETQIRQVTQVTLDLTLLAQALQRYADHLEVVRYKHDPLLGLVAHDRPVTIREIVPDTVSTEELIFDGH